MRTSDSNKGFFQALKEQVGDLLKPSRKEKSMEQTSRKKASKFWMKTSKSNQSEVIRMTNFIGRRKGAGSFVVVFLLVLAIIGISEKVVSGVSEVQNTRIISVGTALPLEFQTASSQKIPSLEFVVVERLDASSIVEGDIAFMSSSATSLLTEDELLQIQDMVQAGMPFIVQGDGLMFRRLSGISPSINAHPGSDYLFYAFFLTPSGVLHDFFGSSSVEAHYRTHFSSKDIPVDTTHIPTSKTSDQSDNMSAQCFVEAVEWARKKASESLNTSGCGKPDGPWNSAYSTRWTWIAENHSFVFDIDVFKLMDTRHHADWYRVDVTPTSEISNFQIDGGQCGWYVHQRDIKVDFGYYDIPGERQSDVAEYGPTSTTGGSTTGYTIGASLSGYTPGLDASYSSSWSTPCVTTTDYSSIPDDYAHWVEDFEGPDYFWCPFNTLNCIPAKATFYSNPSAIGKVISNGIDCPNGTKIRFDPLCTFYYDIFVIACLVYDRTIEVLGGYDGWIQLDVNLDPEIRSFYPQATALDIDVDEHLDFGIEASDPDGSDLTCRWFLDGHDRSTGWTWKYEPSENEVGAHTIIGIVTDCKEGTDEQVWTVSVEDTGAGVFSIVEAQAIYENAQNNQNSQNSQNNQSNPCSLGAVPGFTEDAQADQSTEVSPKCPLLLQCYPNPFNPETEISYGLPNACHVELSIYNLLGQRIRTLVDEYQAAGHKTVHWNGTDQNGNVVSSGVYFYRLEAGELVESRKMVLMK